MVNLERELRPDEALAERVQRALIDLQPINPMALPKVEAAAIDGHVRLSGNVATASQAALIRAAVWNLPGVRTLTDELFDDGNLTLAAWSALADVPELQGIDRRLRLVLGTAYLDWPARVPALERAAGHALRRVPGIRAVVHGCWPAEDYRRETAA